MNADVGKLASNWLAKAENDLKIGQDELRTAQPASDMVCFHLQQCVEKYLKAYLTLRQKPFRRTHDIAELIELCRELDPEFEELYGLQADRLTVYAVDIRYPDDFYLPTPDEAQACLRVALAGRDFVRARLGQAGLDHPAP